MARLYANENFPRRVVDTLVDYGHDVLTIQEDGYANQGISDDDVLAFATAQNRAVLTINRRDFIRLHRQSQNHAGIIICTQDSDVPRQARRIHEVILSAEYLDGQLLRVNRPLK